MKSLADGYKLSNGVEVPCVGFGTWQTPDGEDCIFRVKTAIEAGYRHIDSAQRYENEESVGEAIRQSGIARDEIFVTTKLANPEHGYDKTMAAFQLSLEKFKMDYVDLFLIHWPNPVDFRDNWQEANAGSWKAFEELYKAEKIRAIGISNFRKHHIDALMQTAEITPMVHQMHLCPGDTQEELSEYSRSLGMLLEAYTPLGSGAIFDVPEMKQFAEKYNKSIAQICLKWSIQQGYVPLTRSGNATRIKDNVDIFDFELEEKDVQFIAGLEGCIGLSVDPDTIKF